MIENKQNPVWLVQSVFNGRPLYRSEVEAIISFALDNLMDFDDCPEIWEQMVAKVIAKKKKHYRSQQPCYWQSASSYV